jgi:hypothetical protein
MSKEDIEQFTEMWSKAEGLFWPIDPDAVATSSIGS